MAHSERKLKWTRHSKSNRLRTVAEMLQPRVSRLSINHNQRQPKQAARHRQRLEQPASAQQNVMSCDAMASSTAMDKTTSAKPHKISAAARELSRTNYNKSTTTKAKKSMQLHLILCRRPLATLSIVIGLSAVGLLMLANAIICDTHVRVSDSGNNFKASASVPDAGRQQGAVVQSPTSGTSTSSMSGGHRERILSSLMDSIERQHMKLSPGIRSLALARPSKFDSGSEKLSEQYGSGLANVRINTRSSHQPSTETKQPHVKTLDDIMNQHYGQAARKSSVSLGSSSSSSPAGSRADQELRQIMMLHEQAVPSNATQSTPDKTDSQTTATGASLHFNLIGKHLARVRASAGLGSSNSTAASNQLWSMAAAPLLNDATKAAKVLTNVVSYLSPVAAAAVKKQRAPVNSTNPFTPRMNGKSLLLGPLLGLGQMFAPDMKQQTSGNKYTSPLFGGNSPQTQATYVLSNAINQPQGYSSSLKGFAKDKKPEDPSSEKDLVIEASSIERPSHTKAPGSGLGSWIKIGANQLAQTHSFQDSFRDLLTLSQLPILLNGPVSTAPSELEPGGKKYAAKKGSQQQHQLHQIKGVNRTQAFDDIFRYVYILGNLAARRKRDPLKVLGPSPTSNALMLSASSNKHPLWSLASQPGLAGQNPLIKLNSLLANRKIKPRGVMWDMATDPSLAVTVFHLLERASVALPLGFLLMPFVHMIRNPLNGINLGRIIPARASHRSVDYEELAKKMNNVDKMLSRALRPTHRESPPLSFMRRR